MDSSPNLALPYIVAAQAQKHVTHNEAIRGLDAIVQLMVLDKDLATPPGSPADGARYIVASSPTGVWSGQTGKIAAWQDGAWAFYTPGEGWVAWAADEDKAYVYTGSAWAVLVTTALGFTPVNKAGDTGVGALTLTGLLILAANGLALGTTQLVASGGNIGVGTASPVYTLEVFKSGSPAGLRLFNSGSQNPDFQMFDTTAGGFGMFATAGSFNIYKVNSSGTFVEQWLKILSDGKLGIGTTSPSNKLSVEGIAAPQTDNAYTLGTSAKRWSEVYAATGTINTSDARHKTDIADNPLGLDFVLSLKPRAYRWLDGGTQVEWVDEACEELEPVVEQEVVSLIEIVDGRPVERRVEHPVPVVDLLPVVDGEGRAVLAGGKPKLHPVQRMAKVTRTRRVKREATREGARTHCGLIAQEVKAALDRAGAGNFAGWVLADKDDAQSVQGLRYHQFIAPLVTAVQELAGRVATRGAKERKRRFYVLMQGLRAAS